MNQLKVNELKRDVKQLLECLHYDPSAAKQALLTLGGIFSSNDGQSNEYFKDIGGLNFVLSLIESTTNEEVKESGFFCLGCCVEKNIFCQKALTSSKTFTFLHKTLSSSIVSTGIKQTATFFLLHMVSNNGDGQTLSRASRCLADLLVLLRSVFPSTYLQQGEPEESWFDDGGTTSLDLWASVVSALCVCCNNPLNEENQHLCALSFPFVFGMLQTVEDESIEHSLLSFIRFTVLGNMLNKIQVLKCKGLSILYHLLKELLGENKTTVLHLALVIELVSTIDACITDSVENAKAFIDLNGHDLLVKLLFLEEVVHTDQIQIVVTLCHLMELTDFSNEIINSFELPRFVQLLTKAEDEELSKALKYLLHLSVSNSSHQDHEAISENQEGLEASMVIMHKIEEINGRLRQIEQQATSKIPEKALSFIHKDSHNKKEGCMKNVNQPAVYDFLHPNFQSHLTGSSNGNIFTSNSLNDVVAKQNQRLNEDTVDNIINHPQYISRNVNIDKILLNGVEESDLHLQEESLENNIQNATLQQMHKDKLSNIISNVATCMDIVSKDFQYDLNSSNKWTNQLEMCPLETDREKVCCDNKQKDEQSTYLAVKSNRFDADLMHEESEKEHGFVRPCKLPVSKHTTKTAKLRNNDDTWQHISKYKRDANLAVTEIQEQDIDRMSVAASEFDVILIKNANMTKNKLVTTPYNMNILRSFKEKSINTPGSIYSVKTIGGSVRSIKHHAQKIEHSEEDDSVSESSFEEINDCHPQESIDPVQNCPGCTGYACDVSEDQMCLNSRTYNILIEMSPFTCEQHRNLRNAERQFIESLKQYGSCKRLPLFTQYRVGKMGDVIENNEEITRGSQSDVYDFHSDSEKKQISPPISSAESISKKVQRLAGHKAKHRKPRVPYTAEEEANIVKGVEKYGYRWKTILLSYDFHPSRKSTDLKEKYYRILSKEAVSSPAAMACKSTRIHKPFSMCEERRLIRGIKKFGYNWKTILQSYRFVKERTSEHLRNHWRFLRKHRCN